LPSQGKDVDAVAVELHTTLRICYIASLMPRRISHTLAGQAVAKTKDHPELHEKPVHGAVRVNMGVGKKDI